MSAGATRVLVMFSVVMLALASPVYLRLAESPGLAPLLRLIVVAQIAPTLVLTLVDAWLARHWPRLWSRWRLGLCGVALLATARQLQVALPIPVPAADWIAVLVGVAMVLAVGLAVVCARVAIERFLAAFAPALIVWTVLVAYPLLPPARAIASVTPASARPAVFILLFDELDRDIVMPGGHVRPEWTNFRRLVDRAAYFTDATANYARTCPSVGSMLTGRRFERALPSTRACLRDVPGFRDENLLSLAARRLTVRLHGQYLTYCMDGSFECRGTAYVQARAPHLPLLQHYVPDGVRLAFRAEQVLDYSQHTYTQPVFEEFLRGVRGVDARGRFHWVHVLLPHSPYVLDAEGRVHRPDFPDPARSAGEYRRMLAAYQRQVGFVDRLLGRFLDRLEAEGLADDAIVVVTSDHGLSSLHPFAAPAVVDGFEANAARPRVPLIVRAPRVTPGPVTTDYQHVDFKGLVLGLIDGAGAVLPGAAREKLFCDGTTWYVRGADGRWHAQIADGRPRACGAS